MEITIALVGFGNVGQALARLVDAKNPALRENYGLNISITGVSTGRHGCAIDSYGVDISRMLEAIEQTGSVSGMHSGKPIIDTPDFIRRVPAEIIVETMPLNPESGQPALDYLRLALHHKRHIVTANKGPVAFAYQELKSLARQHNCAFLFESTVMDGTPIFNLVRATLPLIDIQRVRGILNSTTNSILSRMETGMSFENALQEMQQAGIAETNPSYDVDGWDAAVKITILANVFMHARLTPHDVNRTGIGALTVDDVQAALRAGQVIKLVCEARYEHGAVTASVKPVALPVSDPLAQVRGTENIVSLETDMISRITISEGEAGPTATAYGCLVDIINIARGYR
jgi:homoserine dehydrogenase